MSTDMSETLKAALQKHQSGLLDDAEAAYRRVLDAQPRNADALYLLGVLNLQTGNSDAALELTTRAIDVSPAQADYHNIRGEAHRLRRDYQAAIESYEEAIALRPDFAGAYLNLGNALKETGRFEQAAEKFQRVLSVDPDLPMAHNNLGVVWNRLGRLDDAADCFRRAIELMPDYAEAHTNMGNLLQEQGKLDAAAEHHRRAISLAPGFAEAHCNLGRVLVGAGRLEEALGCLQQAVTLDPGLAVAHNNLGIVLDELRRPDEAVLHYEIAIETDPGYADAHNNLANAFDELGRQDDAVRHYAKAVEIEPGFAEARRHLARLRPSVDQVEEIRARLSDESLSTKEMMHLHLALGEIYQHRGDYDAAFAQFAKGNSLKRATVRYDPDAFTDHVDRLQGAYSTSLVRKLSAFGSDSELPVFIVGMPRSGTTLVEQIISSHPRVSGAGELDELQRIERRATSRPGSAGASVLSPQSIETSSIPGYADSYLNSLRDISTHASRITDKAPGNFLRIGLIKILFPNARIIHCYRNSMDTCTSVFLTYFVRGHEFSYDLNELARYYIDYARLMRHWDELFPGDILHLSYEDLVFDQEATSIGLIDYIGLEWDSRCLEYFRNERPVRTASSAQVRRPIYTNSVDRWRRYADHLEPLTELLVRDGAPRGWADVAEGRRA